MVLETLNERRVNIKRLVIEEPKPARAGLDFTDMVTAGNLVRIIDAITRLKRVNLKDFLKAAFSLMVISPEQVDKLKTDENLLNGGYGDLENWAYLKLSFPGAYRDLSRKEAPFLKEKGDNLYGHLRSVTDFLDHPWPLENNQINNPLNIPQSLVEAKILYPTDAFQNMIDLFVPGMVNTLNPIPLSGGNVKDLESWLRKARMLRILAPQSIDIRNLNKANLGSLKMKVLSLKGARFWWNLIRFTNMVADMTILAAEDVQVTSYGLVLIQNKEPYSFEPSIPKLPEIRKF